LPASRDTGNYISRIVESQIGPALDHRQGFKAGRAEVGRGHFLQSNGVAGQLVETLHQRIALVHRGRK
jgi:hypothetical protein